MPLRLSVIIPAFNEAEGLRVLIPELTAQFRSMNVTSEVLVIDDGSSDATPDVIREWAQKDPIVRGFILERNTGKGGALSLGFERASGEIIVTMDGDGQDVPANIPLLLAGIDRGADVVIGWKKDRADSWSRRTTSKMFNTLSCVLLGTIRLHDANSGMKAYRRNILNDLPLHGSMFRFLTFFLIARGCRAEEAPVSHRLRRYGHSKFSFFHRLRGIPDLLLVAFLLRRGRLSRKNPQTSFVPYREIRHGSVVVQH